MSIQETQIFVELENPQSMFLSHTFLKSIQKKSTKFIHSNVLSTLRAKSLLFLEQICQN